MTWEAGDAERYVAEAIADGVDTIIAAGGDGTLSEVATTLAHRDERPMRLPALGLVPLGTANDFASAAGIPAEAAGRAATDPRTWPRMPIDLLKLRRQWRAPTGRQPGQRRLRHRGHDRDRRRPEEDAGRPGLRAHRHVQAGPDRADAGAPARARTSTGQGDFIALGIGNGRQAGGGQALCPEALVDDGLLDLTIVPPNWPAKSPATVGTLMTDGKDAALDRVAMRARAAVGRNRGRRSR